MGDIVIETLRALVTGVALLGLIRGERSYDIENLPGWKIFLAGFALILFGTIIDITDNFETLNRFLIIGDTPAQAFLEKVVGYTCGFMLLAYGILHWLPRVAEHQKEIVASLQKAEEEVMTLEGLLPICAACKQIRDDQGYWNQIENFIMKRSDAQFSHCICPNCLEKLYPEVHKELEAEKAEKFRTKQL